MSEPPSSGSEIKNTPTEDSTLNNNAYRVQNPLLNDVILRNVTQLFDYGTLKSARMVCRKWKQALHKTFEKKTMVHLEIEICNEAIEDFTQTMTAAELEGRIYTRLHFKNPQILNRYYMWSWIAEYGKHIKSLKLGPNVPSCKTEIAACIQALGQESELYFVRMRTLESLLVRWCPNLKHLSIPFPRINEGYDYCIRALNPVLRLTTLELGNSNEYVNYRNGHSVERLAETIFKYIESVKKLTLRSSRNTLNHNLMSFVNFLLSDKDKNILLIESLNTLDLSHYSVNVEAFKILSNLNLKNLRHLKIGQVLDDYHTINLLEATACFQIFLNIFAPQMESLCLQETRQNYKWKITLPEMPALKTLKIHFLDWRVGTIDFVLQLPKLIKLSISSRDWLKLDGESEIEQGRNSNISFLFKDREQKNLETLKWIDRINDIRLVARLERCFPNLKQIQINLGGEVFGESLCKLSLLEHLKQLKIWIIDSRYENLNTSLIANLPRFLELKNLSLTFRLQKEERDDDHINEIEFMPLYVGKRLNLSVDAVQDGFLQCPKLVSLFLQGVKMPFEASEMLMKSDLQLTACDYLIDNEYGDQIEPIGVFDDEEQWIP